MQYVPCNAIGQQLMDSRVMASHEYCAYGRASEVVSVHDECTSTCGTARCVV